MDATVTSVMTEANKMLILHFARALLGRVTSEHLNSRDTILLIEDVEYALGQEKINLSSVAKVVDSVLGVLSCPSAKECLEYSRAWEVATASKADVHGILDTILKKWMDLKIPMPQEAVCLQ